MKGLLIITMLLTLIACSGVSKTNGNPKLKHVTTITKE